MNEKAKVSYIIVTWNNEDIIEECIDSLLMYSMVENEIIVVDNDSKDTTCQTIRKKYKKNVILIETGKNLGFSKANNLGLKYATGEYIFFVNPDVIFIEDIVTPMLNVLDKNKQVGIVSPKLLYKDKSYQVSCCNFPSIEKLIWDDCHLFKILSKKQAAKKAQAQDKSSNNRVVDWTYGAAQLCRSCDVRKVGGYPEGYFMYGEDTEFCMSFLKELNLKTFYLGKVSLVHLGGYSEKQVINSRKVEYGTKAAMYFVKKYYGQTCLILYRGLLAMISLIKYIIYSIKENTNSKQKYQNSKQKWKISLKTVLKYKGEQN